MLSNYQLQGPPWHIQAACPCCELSVMPLLGSMFGATLFFVNANYQVSQQLVSTNFVCAAMLPLAVRESIA